MAPGGIEISVLVEVVEELRREGVMAVVSAEEVEGTLGRSDEVVVLVWLEVQGEVDALTNSVKVVKGM